jgi:hypothetical protein
MTDREPVGATNLDRHGSPALPWSRPHDLLVATPGAAGHPVLPRDVPAGRPAPLRQRRRRLARRRPLLHQRARDPQGSQPGANPACTFSVGLEGIDLVLEGDALTAPFSAPSAGPPPWHLYLFTSHTAFGVATAEPYGATRWRFER